MSVETFENLPTLGKGVGSEVLDHLQAMQFAVLSDYARYYRKLHFDYLWRIQVEFRWLNSVIMERERVAKKPVNSRENTGWKGFVDVKLTDGEKESFRAWDAQPDDVWLLYAEAIVAGHKFSLTFNAQNENFVASFTGQDGAGSNAGFTLSAFSGDWFQAVRVLVFKHALLLEGDYMRASQRPSEDIG